MLMMPPPYKSPPMNAQPAQNPSHQIMNSPTINRSPHYGLPTENGTTSEDSDGMSIIYKCKPKTNIRIIFVLLSFSFTNIFLIFSIHRKCKYTEETFTRTNK